MEIHYCMLFCFDISNHTWYKREELYKFMLSWRWMFCYIKCLFLSDTEKVDFNGTKLYGYVALQR